MLWIPEASWGFLRLPQAFWHLQKLLNTSWCFIMLHIASCCLLTPLNIFCYCVLGFQLFFGFGIFFWHLGILTILAFLASLTFWHYEIQKKTALKSKDAKIKAALVFNGVFFYFKMPRCQKYQRFQNGQMPRCKKICQNAKRPKKCQSILKKMPTIPRCQNQRNQGDIWDISSCCV